MPHLVQRDLRAKNSSLHVAYETPDPNCANNQRIKPPVRAYFQPAEELTPFVEKLAHRIASFPAHAIAHAKAAVDTGAFSSMAEGLLVEAHESDLSVASEVTQARVTEALKVGAETYEGELEMDYLSRLSPIR
jgi:enoyl-CoA hydratase/carnithine racemase